MEYTLSMVQQRCSYCNGFLPVLVSYVTQEYRDSIRVKIHFNLRNLVKIQKYFDGIQKEIITSRNGNRREPFISPFQNTKCI